MKSLDFPILRMKKSNIRKVRVKSITTRSGGILSKNPRKKSVSNAILSKSLPTNKKKKKKKVTPFENFSTKDSKKILELYKSSREVHKGRVKSKSEIEKERQIALNQYYESGLFQYRKKNYKQAYEIFKRGFASLQHAITHIFDSTIGNYMNQTKSITRKRRKDISKQMNLLNKKTLSSKSLISNEEENDVEKLSIMEFIKTLSRNMSYKLAKICYLLEYFDECVYFSEKTLLVDPISIKCFEYISFSQFHSNNFEEASVFLEKLLLLVPNPSIPPSNSEKLMQINYDDDEAGSDDLELLDIEDHEKHEKQAKRKQKQIRLYKLYFESLVSLITCFKNLKNYANTIQYSSILISHLEHVITHFSDPNRIPLFFDDSNTNIDSDENNNNNNDISKYQIILANILYLRAKSYENLENSVDAESDFSRILSYNGEFLNSYISSAEEIRNKLFVILSNNNNDKFGDLKQQVSEELFDECIYLYLEILKIENNALNSFVFSIIICELYILETRVFDEQCPKAKDKIRKNYEQAVSFVSSAIILKNNNRSFSSQWNNSLENEGWMKNIKIYESLEDNLFYVYNLRAYIFEKLENYEKSIVDYTFSRNIDESEANNFMFLNRGLLFLKLNRLSEAKSDFEEYWKRMKLAINITSSKPEENVSIKSKNNKFKGLFMELYDSQIQKLRNSEILIFKFLFQKYKEFGEFEKCVDVCGQLYTSGGFFESLPRPSQENPEKEEERERENTKDIENNYSEWIKGNMSEIINCYVTSFFKLKEREKIEKEMELEKNKTEKEEKIKFLELKIEENSESLKQQKVGPSQKQGGKTTQRSKKNVKSSKDTASKPEKNIKLELEEMKIELKNLKEDEDEEEKKYVPSLYQLSINQYYKKFENLNGPYEEILHKFRKNWRNYLIGYYKEIEIPYPSKTVTVEHSKISTRRNKKKKK